MSFEVHLCRTCLSREKSENTKNILTDYLHITTYSMKVSIVEAFYEITKMIVDTNEPLTHRICLTCVRKLRQAYLFRIMTTKSYETLCQASDIEQVPFKNEDEKIFYTKEESVLSIENDDYEPEESQPAEEYLQIIDESAGDLELGSATTSKVVIKIKKEDMEPGEVREFINVTTKQPVRILKKATPPKQKRVIVVKNEPGTIIISSGPIMCDLCPATFKNTRACFIHMKKYHISKKPYKCWYEGCGRLYRSAGQRKAHENAIHLKLKRFVCATCGMSFTDNPKLTSHTRIHTGERPYKCGTVNIQRFLSLTNHY